MIFLLSSDETYHIGVSKQEHKRPGPLGVQAVLEKTSRGSQEAVNPESASDKKLLPTPPETHSVAVTYRIPVYANCNLRLPQILVSFM